MLRVAVRAGFLLTILVAIIVLGSATRSWS
jgi:hypothetical protein